MKLNHPVLVLHRVHGGGRMTALVDPSQWGDHDAFLGFVQWDHPREEVAGWYELGKATDLQVLDRSGLASVVREMIGKGR